MANSLNVASVNSSSITITGLATADEYEVVLQLIFYNSTSPNPGRATRTIVFTITDNLMMSDHSDTAITLVHIIPTNNYALLVFNASQNLTYTEANQPVHLFTGLTNIIDPDPVAFLQWMTVTISNPSVGDVLNITAPFPGNLTVPVTTATSLNISGSANLATYIKALQNVTYSNSYIALQNGQRTVAVVTFDGTVQSPQQNFFISVYAVDNPPICYFGNMVCEITRAHGMWDSKGTCGVR